MPAVGASDGNFRSTAHQPRQIILPEMLLGFHGRTESRSSLFANGRIRDDLARLFLPLFNQSGIGHDLDLSLIIGKTHPPAEALFVKAAKLRLIVVMIGWTKKRSARTTTGNIREIAFDRLRQRSIDVVEFFVAELKVSL